MTLHRRYLLSVAVVFLSASAAFPQESVSPPKEENLSASIIEMEKSWGLQDNTYLGIRTDYQHMLVERDLTITKDLPEQFGDH